MIRKLGAWVVLVCGCVGALAAGAEEYPSHPVRIVVGVAAGSGTDLTARFLANGLGHALGQSFVVENRPGAGGNIAADVVAKAPADGYTLLFTASTHYINKFLYAKLPFDPVKDFRPVAQLSQGYVVLLVPAASPFKSVKDVIDYMKANPGQLTYASAGNGSTTHLAPSLLFSMAGVKGTHVPYKDGVTPITDTITGRVDLTFGSVPLAMPHVRSGKLRALAVTSLRRSGLMPAVPTMAELGYPGYEIVFRLGLMAPSGVADDIVAKLSAASVKIASTPEFATASRPLGTEPDVAGADGYAAEERRELDHWAKVVAISGAKVD